MQNIGFKSKLLIAMTMVIIVCVGSYSFLSYQREKNVYIETIYTITKERVTFESEKIGDFLKLKTDAVTRLADDYNKRRYQDNHVQRMKFGAKAINVTNLEVGFDNGVAYTSYNYPGWVDNKNPSSYDHRVRPWYKIGTRNPDKAFIIGPYNDIVTKEPMVTIGKSIGNGVLIADISLGLLDDVISEINLKGSAAAIITQDNSVIASNSDVVKTGTKLTDYKSLVDASESIKQINSSIIDYHLEGKEKILFAEKIPYKEADWYLLVGLNKEIVLSGLSDLKQQAVMYLTIYTLFAVLVTLLTLNTLYKPILVLKKTILGLSEGSGHLTQRIDVTSSDDLGEIAQGVNLFVDRIQALLLLGSSDKSSQRWTDAFEQYQNRVEKEEEFQEELKLDELTRLPTRSYFEIMLADAIKDVYEKQKELLLLSVNIGNFETISESYTYNQLQRAILELAKYIELDLPKNTILSRTGQAEFSIIYNRNGKELDSDSIVKDLAMRLKSVETEPLIFYCKVGASHLTYTDDRPSVSGILYQVSSALFSVVDNAIENYAFFHRIRDAEKELKQALVSEFKQALKREGELELYFQPQIDLRTGSVCGAEALIRWNHPEKGFLTPDKFLHILDNDLLNVQFGEWVIISALEKLAQREDALKISVNITPYHLQRENFTERLEQILRSYPTSVSERLKIELTETSGVSDHGSVEMSMRKCSQFGVCFSLDDFGTGYSTLNQLRTLSASELKIDRSFVKNIEQSKDDRKMVGAMIMLANKFEINVVVEGVETRNQELILRRLGCSIVQGFYYSKPIPYTEFNQWLEQPRAFLE